MIRVRAAISDVFSRFEDEVSLGTLLSSSGVFRFLQLLSTSALRRILCRPDTRETRAEIGYWQNIDTLSDAPERTDIMWLWLKA